jgi:hypothetical protein
MSQKTHVEILRCVVVLKVFSKKHSFLVQKTRPLSETTSDSPPVRRCFAAVTPPFCRTFFSPFFLSRLQQLG